jgi:hypothetical protein
VGDAVGDAVGETLGDALGDTDRVLGVGTVRCRVVSAPVRSVRDGGSGGPVGAAIRSSTSMESRTERVMPTTAAPRKITGAKAAVSGKSTHGESPAWVCSRRI